MIKDKILCIIFIFIAQIFVWFQGYAPKYLEWMKANWIPYALAIPTTFLFITSIKYGISGFKTIWQIRIFSFVIGNIVFMILTKLIVDESLNLKNGISLILCLLIVLVQVFIKD